MKVENKNKQNPKIQKRNWWLQEAGGKRWEKWVKCFSFVSLNKLN